MKNKTESLNIINALLKESRRIDLENKKGSKRVAHKIGDSFSIFYLKKLKELIDSE
jgi:hypothetical protein